MVMDVLQWQGWQWTFLAAAFATLLFAAHPLKDDRGVHHTTGAALLLLEWVMTFATRGNLGEQAMLVFHSVFDLCLTGAFLTIAVRNRAVWAAFCVIFKFGMIVAHLQLYLGEIQFFYYVFVLNILYALSLLSINAGVWAGRYDRNRVLDRLVHNLPLRPTFSGFSLSGNQSDNGPD